MTKQCIKNAAHPVAELSQSRRSVSPAALRPRSTRFIHCPSTRLADLEFVQSKRQSYDARSDRNAIWTINWREVTTRLAVIERGSCLISRFPITLAARELDEHISASKSDVLGSGIRENHWRQSSLASSDRSRSRLHNAV